MDRDEFPLILGPNLGCPLIVEEKEFRNGTPEGWLTLIVAGRYGECASPVKDVLGGRLFLRPSYPDVELEEEVELIPAGPPTEIKDWNTLTEFQKPDDTRELLSNILHYGVLGEATRYFKVQVKAKPKEHDSPQEIKNLLRRVNRGGPLPTLYDLVMERPPTRERVNYHSVQLVRTTKGAFQFIHLTDLHISKRNDEILGEVLQDKQERPRKTIESKYVNFNNNVRHFIKNANKLADQGKLDFVVITGDLVDFTFHGWEYSANPSENNWRTFRHIFTGSEKEKSIHENEGIKVAIFTSTGNHDWRAYPYHLERLRQYEAFGLTKEEVKSSTFKRFDLDEFRRYEKAYEGSPDMAWNSFRIPSILDVARLMKRIRWAYRIVRSLPVILIALCVCYFVFLLYIEPPLGEMPVWEFLWNALKDSHLVVRSAVVIALVTKVLAKIDPVKKLVKQLIIKLLLSKAVEKVVSTFAAPMSLYYYFKHINPYLDYVFQYGDHLFIIMDSGMDYPVGEVTEKAQSRERQGPGFSIADNILGGSPDSYGFDYRKLYYDWSQIVWLEKALEIPRYTEEDENNQGEKETTTTRRHFVFVHAPPLNPNIPEDGVWFPFTESHREHTEKPYAVDAILWPLCKFLWYRFKAERRMGTKLSRVISWAWLKEGKEKFDSKRRRIDESEYWLTYGTLNNYRSHFFFLCMGYRENEVRSKGDFDRKNGVDMVFSGHAHRNIEFRVDLDEEQKGRISFLSDLYSWQLEEFANDPDRWWKVRRPVIVQTAAGGLRGSHDKKPPYYRRVSVDSIGRVTQFLVRRVDVRTGAEVIVRRDELLGGMR